MSRYAYKKNTGFTLMEILISIGIVAILAGISYVVFLGEPERARDKERVNRLNILEVAMAQFYSDFGRYPKIDTSATYNLNEGRNCRYIDAIDGDDKLKLKSYLEVIPSDPDINDSNRMSIINFQYSVDDNDNPQKYIIRAAVNRNDHTLSDDYDILNDSITENEAGNFFCRCHGYKDGDNNLIKIVSEEGSTYDRYCVGDV